MKVNLTKITRYSTKKDGSPYQDKNGKQYHRVVIETEEHDESISMLDFDNATYGKTAGDTLEIDNVEENDYGMNADITEEPSGDHETAEKIQWIKHKMEYTILPLLEELAKKQGIEISKPKEKVEDGINYPDEEITESDIPF
jgi:single-stranded DNA-binding protein